MELRNPGLRILPSVMRQLKTNNLQTMKTYKIGIIILTLCLQTNLFADIAPNPIKAKSISPQDQTSIRMKSEKVIIELYNDSSVVKCSEKDKQTIKSILKDRKCISYKYQLINNKTEEIKEEKDIEFYQMKINNKIFGTIKAVKDTK